MSSGMIEALPMNRRSFVFALLFQNAEPVRVGIGQTVHGSLRNRQQKEYEFTGQKGSQVEFVLRSSPLRSVRISTIGPDGTNLPLEELEGGRWQSTLPGSGDFVIVVSRIHSTRGRSTFSLTLGRQK